MKTHWLATLLQGYLHQDWREDYASVWDGVADYIDHEGPDAASGLVDEIESVLTAHPSEHEVRGLVLDELGSGYYPPGDGVGFAEWLSDVAKRVTAHRSA